MKTHYLLTALCLAPSLMATAQSERPATPPPSPKCPVVDTYFGKAVTDTYRNFANMYAFALWQAGHRDFQPSDRSRSGVPAGAGQFQKVAGKR